MNQTVIGIFDEPSDAQKAVQQLLVHGFSRSDIDISTQSTQQNDERVGSFFSSLFGTDKSQSYTEVARQSGAIVTVHVGSEDEAMQAAEILDEAGAVDMDERAWNFQSAEQAGQEKTMVESDVEKGVFPVIEEHLEVGKREVETGRVRLHSKIIEQPVEESIRLREEHVHVERHAVNRPVTEAELGNFKDRDIEMTEHAEVPVVNKEARVVEEITYGKEVEEHEEIVREKLRKTQVDVESGKRPQ